MRTFLLILSLVLLSACENTPEILKRRDANQAKCNEACAPRAALSLIHI